MNPLDSLLTRKELHDYDILYPGYSFMEITDKRLDPPRITIVGVTHSITQEVLYLEAEKTADTQLVIDEIVAHLEQLKEERKYRGKHKQFKVAGYHTPEEWQELKEKNRAEKESN